MEHKLVKISFVLFIGVILSSCDMFEFRGFVSSYESVDERFDQSMEWNKTNPFKDITVSESSYTIFAMADSHVGGTNNLNYFITQAIKEQAIAAVMVGDLTTGNSEDFDTFKQQLPGSEELQTFQVVGNHDLYFHGWQQFYTLFGGSTYLFKVKTPQATDLFICLDTGGGTLGRKQLEWLKDILESERSKYRHCIVFTHNNLFRIRKTISTNPFVEELRVLNELCIAHNIDMVVTGHDHKSNVAVFGNTTHITMDALQDGYKNAGYLRLNFAGDKIEYKLIEL